MAWALWSGLTASSLVIEAINNWSPSLTKKWHEAQNELRMRRMRSQLIAFGLRSNLLRNIFVNVATAFPVITSPLVQAISGARTNQSYSG